MLQGTWRPYGRSSWNQRGMFMSKRCQTTAEIMFLEVSAHCQLRHGTATRISWSIAISCLHYRYVWLACDVSTWIVIFTSIFLWYLRVYLAGRLWNSRPSNAQFVSSLKCVYRVFLAHLLLRQPTLWEIYWKLNNYCNRFVGFTMWIICKFLD